MKPGRGFNVAVGSQRSRDRYHHADDRRKWPLLARVWPFLLVFEKPDPDALPPGPVLVPHQCRQDSGAHYAAVLSLVYLAGNPNSQTLSVIESRRGCAA